VGSRQWAGRSGAPSTVIARSVATKRSQRPEQLHGGCPPRPRLPRAGRLHPGPSQFRFFASFLPSWPMRSVPVVWFAARTLQSREAFRNSGRVFFTYRHVKRPVLFLRQPPHLAPAWPTDPPTTPREPLFVQGTGYPPFGGLPGPGVRSRTRRYGTWRLRALRRSIPLRKHMPPCSWIT